MHFLQDSSERERMREREKEIEREIKRDSERESPSLGFSEWRPIRRV